MKFLFFTVFVALVYNGFATEDLITIKLKSGETQTLNVHDVKEIFFDIPASVQDFSHEEMKVLSYPNPFTSSTNIEFELPQNSKSVTITIFDESGKSINTLNCENCAFGKNTITWDGKDFNGNELPTGAYFVTIDYGDGVLFNKLMMNK